jgi:hypothetical protein
LFSPLLFFILAFHVHPFSFLFCFPPSILLLHYH